MTIKQFSVKIGFITFLLFAPLSSSWTEPAHFLWRVESQNNTVYLLGSVHMLTKDDYPLPPLFDQVFDAADIVVFEASLDDTVEAQREMQALIIDRGVYPDGRTLADVLPEDLYARVKERSEAFGIPEAGFARLRPWCITVTLTTLSILELGYQPELGIDRYFFKKAITAGKEIRVLEGLEEQIDLLADLPEDAWRYYLEQALTVTADLREQTDQLFEAWRKGNTVELARLSFRGSEDGPDSTAFYNRINFDRNRAWLKSVVELLSLNVDALIIVGAMHLAGEGSLIDLLTKAGYNPEQM